MLRHLGSGRADGMLEVRTGERERALPRIFSPCDCIETSALNRPDTFTIVTLKTSLTKSHASLTAA